MPEPGGLTGPEGDIIDSSFGGVATGDCDNDGDIDAFITYSDQRANRLYLNQRFPSGGLTVVDRAATAGSGVDFTVGPGQNGRHSGPVFVDLDGDGFLDLFLGALFATDEVKVYLNNGDCTFTDETPGSGLENLLASTTISAGFGDYDLDGDLDMIMSHWGTPDSVYGNRANSSEMLWRNISTPGNIVFENVSNASNLTAITYLTRTWYAFGTPSPPPTARCERFVQASAQNYDYVFTGTFAHLNDDAWPDLLLVGDFATAQVLINDGDADSNGIADGTFTDASTTALCSAQQPMGSALGDYDFDGDLDWFTTSVRLSFQNGTPVPNGIGNRFYRNDQSMGNFSVTDVTGTLGVSAGGWGWGACMLDIDNDMDLDIFHTNGWNASQTDGGVLVQDFRVDPSRLFVFNGTSFTEQSATYGLNDTLSGRGVVCADFDEDGDIDILQTSNRQPNSGLLRENRTAAAGRNYLKVKLTGLTPNTDAAGARIYVTAGGRTQMREVMVGSDNFTSQNPTVQHFGLGSEAQADVRIVWPARQSGATQTADTVLTSLTPVNRTLSCDEATTTTTACP